MNTPEIHRIASEHQRLTGDATPTLESLWRVIRNLWPASCDAPTGEWAARYLEPETLEWLEVQHGACSCCWGTGVVVLQGCWDCDGSGYQQSHEPAERPEDAEADRLDHERAHTAGSRS